MEIESKGTSTRRHEGKHRRLHKKLGWKLLVVVRCCPRRQSSASFTIIHASPPKLSFLLHRPVVVVVSMTAARQIDGEEAARREREREIFKFYMPRNKNDFQLKVKRFFTIIKYFSFLSSPSRSRRDDGVWSRDQLCTMLCASLLNKQKKMISDFLIFSVRWSFLAFHFTPFHNSSRIPFLICLSSRCCLIIIISQPRIYI